MKIRNKNTGELATLTMSDNGESLLLMEDGARLAYNVELSDLKDWEEYKYPNYYFIDYDGVIIFAGENEKFKNEMKEIGNYFETREDAEKAVEKLKAWKRLKDKGFKFNSCSIEHYVKQPRGIIGFEIDDYDKKLCKDLNLLFGGENEN